MKPMIHKLSVASVLAVLALVVLVGEVGLASGQSSMAFLLGECNNGVEPPKPTGKHLFILSGQSNMGKLDPDISFRPAVESAFGKDNIIIVKSAQGGQPIRRWYKKWKQPLLENSSNAEPDKETQTAEARTNQPVGDLYQILMKRVSGALDGTRPATVTFIWMQGEADTERGLEKAYKESLLGVLNQLRDDLRRDDINFVIGRLSRFKTDSEWEEVRKAQVEVAEASPRGAWVDTDDLPRTNIHYNGEGSKELGKRFAEKAIALINGKTDSNKTTVNQTCKEK